MNCNCSITIGEETVHPGERKVVMLPMPELYDCSPMFMPITVICGKEKGPTLVITAAIHGDEINGVEIVRRLLRKKSLNKLKGTLIAIPVVNVYGFIYQSRYLMDRRDLNRSFPGSEKGSLAARLAHFILQQVMVKATHVIDLHTGSLHRSNVPQIRATLNLPGNKELAKCFGAPVILNSIVRDGSLRQAVSDLKIPFILYEAGEALRFSEVAIRTGLRGINNILRRLNMIPVNSGGESRCVVPTVAYSSHWVRSSSSGILVPKKHMGDWVKEGESLGIIANPLSSEESKVISDYTGIVIGKTNLPLVHEGQALFHIACVDEPDKIAEEIFRLKDV